MRKILLGAWFGMCMIPGIAATEKPRQVQATQQAVQPKKAVPDSRQLEKDLQSLNWNQFKSVVESIPPIRAEVDKYGLLGWQYVRQNYKTYPWKKPIDRLKNSQKIELAKLIERAKRLG